MEIDYYSKRWNNGNQIKKQSAILIDEHDEKKDGIKLI